MEDTRRGLRRLTGGPRTRRSAWRRGRLRRVAAALAAAAALWTVVGALRPAPPDPGPAVVVAARDLAVGSRVSGADLRVVRAPQAVVPRGAVDHPGALIGRTTSRLLREGQVLTDADTVVAALASGLAPGTVVAHLPLTSPALTSAATPGTRVDILAIADGSVLARGVLVLAPAGTDEGVFVALPGERAGDLARHLTGDAIVGGGVTIVLRPAPP